MERKLTIISELNPETDVPKGWIPDNNLDSQTLSKIKTKSIPVRPAEDASREAENIRTIVYRGIMDFGTGWFSLLMQDKSQREGWCINPIFFEDLNKSPRQLIEELKKARESPMPRFSLFAEVDFKRGAYMAKTGAVDVL